MHPSGIVQLFGACGVIAGYLVMATPLTAAIYRINTVLGDIDVRMFDAATPQTVQNFDNYASSNCYDHVFMHRSVPGFVVQGGGFKWAPNDTVEPVSTDPPVQNEPGISNLRGTIAMAKLGGDPNSATSQWFFNLGNNSTNLDNQNGGFTVFGRVVGNGMSIVDQMAALPVVDATGGNPSSPFGELPVRNLTGNTIERENVVLIASVDRLNLPAGDYNFDGTVDGADYNVWRADFGSTTKAEADGNGNGRVDAADYTVWRNSLGQGSAAATSTVIPEPSNLLLGAFALLSAVALHRRAKRRIGGDGLP